ncbi:MAG: type II toxin-antitoxin system PemK/MazF family toxin [Dermatophilaceae bacterium]
MTVVPGRGDVAGLSMDPTEGHEQRGHRPHLVLSDERLARTMGLVIAVPMTSAGRPWATRIALRQGSYAIGEQSGTFSVSRVARVDREGHDVTPVIHVITTLIGG